MNGKAAQSQTHPEQTTQVMPRQSIFAVNSSLFCQKLNIKLKLF